MTTKSELKLDIEGIAYYTDQSRLNHDFKGYYSSMKYDIEVIKMRCFGDRLIDQEWLGVYCHKIKQLRDDKFPVFMS